VLIDASLPRGRRSEGCGDHRHQRVRGCNLALTRTATLMTATNRPLAHCGPLIEYRKERAVAKGRKGGRKRLRQAIQDVVDTALRRKGGKKQGKKDKGGKKGS
jgi:hypothetical protein